MLSSPVQTLAVAVSLMIVALVIHLIRRGRLRIEYSIVWLIGSGFLTLFALWRNLLDVVADAVGIYYAPAILLLVTMLFATLGFLHFSVRMSRQAEINKRLVQELALLRKAVESLGRDEQAETGSDVNPQST